MTQFIWLVFIGCLILFFLKRDNHQNKDTNNDNSNWDTSKDRKWDESLQKEHLNNFNKSDNFESDNYEAKNTLMTLNERSFFEKLKMAIGDKYDIYPQVNLDKIFKIKYQNSRWKFKQAKSFIDRRSVDFLITTRENQKPFIAIELDDSSHKREDRIERDAKINSLFDNNGFHLVRFNSTDNFTVEELRNTFNKYQV